MRDITEFEHLDDDGLEMPDSIGEWSQQKHRVLYNYAEKFATRMGKKWDNIVYIDFFASAGRAKIGNTNNIVETSPLLALGIPNKFDRYIFCELENRYLQALEARVSSKYPDVDVRFVVGDVNKKTDEILRNLPNYSTTNNVLSFCFVDPFNLKSIQFNTLKVLSKYRMDFLVLIPTGMGPTRSRHDLLRQNNNSVELYLNDANWRNKWHLQKNIDPSFGLFIAGQFSEKMRKLGYIYGGIHESQLIRYIPKNINLYRLGFFSKHPLGEKFWKEAKKYSTDQGSLFD